MKCGYTPEDLLTTTIGFSGSHNGTRLTKQNICKFQWVTDANSELVQELRAFDDR